MGDGAPAHHTKYALKFHTDSGGKLLSRHPSNSPDQENLWIQMKHMHERKHATPRAGLKKLAHKVWKGGTPKYVECIYHSMLRLIQTDVDNEGSYTIN